MNHQKFWLLLVFSCLLMMTGCGFERNQESSGEGPDDSSFDVVLLVHGPLDEQSLEYSAYEGVQRIKHQLDAEVKIVELSDDRSPWHEELVDVSTQNWDMIMTGTEAMVEILEQVAPNFPENRYLLFDAAVDDQMEGLENVYSIQYQQHEGSFLAGALAALVTDSAEMEWADPTQRKIGFLGDVDQSMTYDYLVGYIGGAMYIDESTRVYTTVTGDYGDDHQGKQMALAQYHAGVDIVFGAPGKTALGLLEAAPLANRYALGADTDQTRIFAEFDPQKAESMLTSVVKRVDRSLFRAAQMHLEGTLPYGKAEKLGLKEEAVELAQNDVYLTKVPESIRQQVDEIKEMIVDGEIEVRSAFDMSRQEIDQLIDAVSP